jgi:putative OmpL-like beta-barrel porin-2
MRTVGKKLVGLAVTSLLVSGPAFASSESDNELAEMRAIVDGLKQQVDAQQEQIEHQSGLLQDAQKVVRDQEQSTQSGMSEFWQAIDVNMSVAGSYAYNFHNPSNTFASTGAGQNAGNSGLFYPFHPDHNSFQVDQVWFDIGKETTAESRAGFHATVLYGTTATFLGQGSPAFGRSNSDSTSDYYVHQAYVNYLAPVGEGVQFTFGKFATPIGAEVADASKNWAVTRGNVYNLLQPIDHLGLMASTDIGPVTVAAAVVNEINLGVSSPDINSEKSYLAKVGIGNDMVSFATTVGYGAEGPPVTGTFGGNNNELRAGIVDALLNFNSDAFSAYVNADYLWLEGRKPAAWGVSVAGKVPITEVLSAALRLEYVRDKSTNGGFLASPIDFLPIGTVFNHSEIYGATGTLAYEIAENLTLKGEVRWDRVVEENFSGTFPDEFLTNTGGGAKDQVVGLGQVVYAF